MLLTVQPKNDRLPLLLSDLYLVEFRGTSQLVDTPLHVAAEHGHSGVVKALIENPAYLKQFQNTWTNGWNKTPIDCAKDYPDIQEMIRTAVERVS